MREWSVMGYVVYDGDYLGRPKSAWRLELKAHGIIHDIPRTCAAGSTKARVMPACIPVEHAIE